MSSPQTAPQVTVPDTCPLRGRAHEHDDFRKAELRLTDDYLSRRDLSNSYDESLTKIIPNFGVLTAVKIIFVVFTVVSKPCGFVSRHQPFGKLPANFFIDEVTGSNTCLRTNEP